VSHDTGPLFSDRLFANQSISGIKKARPIKIPRRDAGGIFIYKKDSLPILLSLLTALLAAATLLAALLTTLASGRLVLLTRFLLTTLLLATLLLATLLLVVRHGAILLRGGFRANIQSFAALVGSLTNKSV
jgi:hypothetical protein